MERVHEATPLMVSAGAVELYGGKAKRLGVSVEVLMERQRLVVLEFL